MSPGAEWGAIEGCRSRQGCCQSDLECELLTPHCLISSGFLSPTLLLVSFSRLFQPPAEDRPSECGPRIPFGLKSGFISFSNHSTYSLLCCLKADREPGCGQLSEREAGPVGAGKPCRRKRKVDPGSVPGQLLPSRGLSRNAHVPGLLV